MVVVRMTEHSVWFLASDGKEHVPPVPSMQTSHTVYRPSDNLDTTVKEVPKAVCCVAPKGPADRNSARAGQRQVFGHMVSQRACSRQS